MSAREEILGLVRDAIGASPAPAAPERRYRRHSSDGVETFVERLRDYGARTWTAPSADLAAGVRGALAEFGLRRLVVPDGVPGEWLTEVQSLRAPVPLSPWELDAADGVLSTCAVAIAQTGTIVLDGAEGMGSRILSLVPDRHLCVVRTDQIVGSLPEALALLDPARPLTFISGPSATVDIEMVRVAGVHGPRELGVVIAG